jgi:hypothetical protein
VIDDGDDSGGGTNPCITQPFAAGTAKTLN